MVVLSTIGLLEESGTAQILPELNSTGTIVEQTGNQFLINGGVQSTNGLNLLHNFQQFGLNSEQFANFQPNSGIGNILLQAPGLSPSIIPSLVRENTNPSNLFLINPAGVVFSEIDRLDLPSGALTPVTGGPLSAPSILGNNNQLLNQVTREALSVPSALGRNNQILNQVDDLLTYDLGLAINPKSISPTRLPELLTGGTLRSADRLIINTDGVAQLSQTGDGVSSLTDRELNLQLQRTFQLERSLAGELAKGLNLPEPSDEVANPVSLMQQIAGITGVKPALVYISFLEGNKEITSAPSNNQLELTLVTANGIKRYLIESVDRDTFQTVATNFQQEVANPIRTNTKSYLPAAQKLYQWLIQPLFSELSQQKITNLVFLPVVEARSIPFAALHDGQKFLVEQFSVSLMPSLILTDTRYRDLRKADVLAIGVAESTQGQTSLPTVPTEIEMILKLWDQGDRLLDQQVTFQNLQKARQRKPYGIIHMATHANFGNSDNSYIQLWEQQLQLNQIRQLGWNNPSVDLLVLSACRTALGNRQAELGFAGLALQTGVKTTLASLWAVSDAATTALMSDFYYQLRTSPIKAEALRRSQIRMIRRQVKLSKLGIQGIENFSPIDLPEDTVIPNYNLDHPYYWAAFSMVGNPW